MARCITQRADTNISIYIYTCILGFLSWRGDWLSLKCFFFFFFFLFLIIIYSYFPFSFLRFLFFFSSPQRWKRKLARLKKKYNVLFSRGYLLWTTLCFRKFYLKISPNTFLWPCFTDDFVFQKPTTNLTNICFQTTYLT